MSVRMPTVDVIADSLRMGAHNEDRWLAQVVHAPTKTTS
jgi:hypothetical protein